MRFPAAYVDLSGAVNTQEKYSAVTERYDLCIFSGRRLENGDGFTSAGAKVFAGVSTVEVPWNWEEHPEESFEYQMGRYATRYGCWAWDSTTPKPKQGKVPWVSSEGYPGAEYWARLNRAHPEYPGAFALAAGTLWTGISRRPDGLFADWTDADTEAEFAGVAAALAHFHALIAVPIIGNGYRMHLHGLHGIMLENSNHKPLGAASAVLSSVHEGPSLIHSSGPDPEDHLRAACFALVNYEHERPWYHVATPVSGVCDADNVPTPWIGRELGNPSPTVRDNGSAVIREWEKAVVTLTETGGSIEFRDGPLG